jgi:ABC-type lipoprotein export system ATPase subunit
VSRWDEFLRFYGLPSGSGLQKPADLRSWWEAQPWEEVREAFGTWERFSESAAEWYRDPEPEPAPAVRTLEVLGGADKSGRPEEIRLSFAPGEVVCLVGPTGAGKSRLLADIECLAQGDTPSGRRILLDGGVPDDRARFSIERKLVAQISQNMNFVMDLGVGEFLRLHGQSRGMAEDSSLPSEVLERAVELAGEPFTAATPLTQLSGGQSRALMIADAAYLSPKPIVLIDEIENAGVDRRRALALFMEQGKLVFLSTHDPLLALSGHRRIVIRQGGITAVMETSQPERELTAGLAKADAELSALRERLRAGERLA